ncbi:MAG: STAS domain-containing protein, partial [Bacteroidota bacterium]
MKLKEKTYGGVRVISLDGTLLGEPEVSQLHEAISNVLIQKAQKKIVLDLRNVRYINSSGLGMLIGLLTSARRQGGNLLLAGMNDHVESLFVVTRLVRVFRMYESVKRAVSS